MKNSLFTKSLIAFLIIAMVSMLAVGCKPSPDNGGNAGDNGNINDGGDTNNNGGSTSVDKAALNAEIALEIAEQGDYTVETYNVYAAKLADAKAVASDEAATQEAVDQALAALNAARLALAIRPIEEVEGGNKAFRLISGDNKEIVIADYVNVNGLSKITYGVKTSNAVVELSQIADGKFTITAGEVLKETDVKISIIVSYDGVEKLTVDLSLKITNDKAPVVYSNEVVKVIDLFDLANKASLTIDFAENVDNAGNLALTYSAKCGEETVALDGTLYTIALGSYGEDAVYQTFDISVSCVVNGEAKTITYTYKLGLKDTSAYRVANGNFENGIDGWTASESFGSIKDNSTFWDQNFPMFNVGKYFSSEGAEGTLTSPYFVANSKYATFMIGAAAKENVYVSIEDASGNVLAIYRNTKFADLPACAFRFV